MKVQEQLDRLTGIVASLAASVVHRDDQLDKLGAAVNSLAASVVHHDDQIAAHSEQLGLLIQLADKHKEEMADFRSSMAELRRSMAETDRLFQAYLKRLPPQ